MPALSQDRKNSGRVNISNFHGQLYIGGNTGPLYGIAANVYLSNKAILGLDYNSNHFDATNLPEDYEPGLKIFDDGIPKDKITSYSILLGMYLPSENTLARLAIEAGPGFKTYDETHFTPRPSTGWLDFGSNYDTYITHHSAFGLMAEARLEFYFSRHAGLSLGTSLNVSEYKVLPALKFALLIGNLRGRMDQVKK